MTRIVQPGDIVDVLFPSHDPKGREQEGYRPALVIGIPEVLGTPHYPVVLVVPLTSDKNQAWANAAPHLYPRLPTRTGNLRSPSIALLDQVRGLDVNRIRKYRGTLTSEQYQPIQNGLAKMLSQNQTSGDRSDRDTQEISTEDN
jgi:mRNA interferase MazF